MEEERKLEMRQQLISIHIDNAVRKFKSIHRAVKRGHIAEWFEVYPKRPFNNRKPTRGRSINEYKKVLYYGIKGK
jgi:hypothetical protein